MRVAVLGSGVQGLMATALSRRSGASHIYVTDFTPPSSPERAEHLEENSFALARRFGADHCFDMGLESGPEQLRKTVNEETDGTGVDAWINALDAEREKLVSSGRLASLRREQREAHAIECLERRYGSYGVEKIGGSRELSERARERGAESTFGLVAELGREIEDALRKPA